MLKCFCQPLDECETDKRDNFLLLTLMLLVANLANINWCKKNFENDWNPGTWVLLWEYSAKAIQWIPTWQGLDVFQKSLHCALGESRPSIGRVNLFNLAQPQKACRFWRFLSKRSKIWKIFEGEILTRTQPPTLLQVFCESMLYGCHCQTHHKGVSPWSRGTQTIGCGAKQYLVGAVRLSAHLLSPGDTTICLLSNNKHLNRWYQ